MGRCVAVAFLEIGLSHPDKHRHLQTSSDIQTATEICKLMTLWQAERCTAEMRSLSSELESAQPSLTSAAETEDAAAAACARCTPALLQESVALKQHLTQSLPAASRLKAQLPHLHMVAADLKLMSAQVRSIQAELASVKRSGTSETIQENPLGATR